MIHLDVRINTAAIFPFVEATNQTGVTVFPYTILKDGIAYGSVVPIFDEISGGVYTAELTFTEVGQYSIIIQDEIAAFINGVEKDVYTILQDLDDVAQGSWVYDKTIGTLTLKRQNGSDLASFDVVDDENTSSRELI